MRERIARALAALEYERDHGKPMPADFSGPDYDWRDWQHEADAVLAAMREPTDEMLAAVSSDVVGFDCHPATYWQAMIDAARSTPTTPNA